MLTYRDLAYARVDGKNLLLDLYLPEQAGTPLPALLWVHGGAFRAGSKENPRALRMVDRGYAVASINYRLSQEAIFPAQIHDCKAAVRWLRAHAGQSQQRFHVIGNHVAVLGGDHHRALVQALGPPRVPQLAPGPQHFRRSSCRRRRRRRPPADPVHPDRRDPGHRGLLQHELADQNLPGGGARRPPGQVAASLLVPAQEIGGRDAHRLPANRAGHNDPHGQDQSGVRVEGTEGG